MVGRKPDVSSVDFVDEADVVIVGGGIIGCSIAYHLGRLGITDVLVLERNELSAQATARAAGLVPDLLLSTWDLRPFTDDADFLVASLRPQ